MSGDAEGQFETGIATVMTGALLAATGLLVALYWAFCHQRALWSPAPLVVFVVIPLVFGTVFCLLFCPKHDLRILAIASAVCAVPLSVGILVIRDMPPQARPNTQLSDLHTLGPGALIPLTSLHIDRSRCRRTSAFVPGHRSPKGRLELFVSCPLESQPFLDSELWAGLSFTNLGVSNSAIDDKTQSRELRANLRRRADAWLNQEQLQVHGVALASSGRRLRLWQQAADNNTQTNKTSPVVLEVHRTKPLGPDALSIGMFAFLLFSASTVVWFAFGIPRPDAPGPATPVPVLSYPFDRQVPDYPLLAPHSDPRPAPPSWRSRLHLRWPNWVDEWGLALSVGTLSVLIWVWMGIVGASPLSPSGADIIEFGGASAELLKTEPWRLFTHIFVHSGAMHLLANLGALWFLQLALGASDPTLKNWLSCCTFLFGGMAGGLFSSIQSDAVVCGASGGAVAIGCLVVGNELFARSKDRWATKIACWVLAPTLLLSWLPGVALWAHLGGALVGLVAGLTHGLGQRKKQKF